MIRFYNGANDFIQGKRVIPSVGMTEEQWDDLCSTQFLRLQGGDNTGLETSERTITISAEFGSSAEDRYNAYVETKMRAMQYGNDAAGVSNTTDYHFALGFEGKIYRNGSASETAPPYLQSVQQTPPTSTGELFLLSSDTVGIDIERQSIDAAPYVSIQLEGQMCDTCGLYREFNAYAWRLYHAVNEQAHRLFKYDPAHHYWGALMSYQALVAKWNHSVWLNSYLVNVTTLREGMAFEMGYTCTACSIGQMTITAVIRLVDGFIPYGYSHPSSEELLMYKMGTSQVADQSVKDATTVTITRFFPEGSGIGPMIDNGYGNETINLSRPAWTEYEVTVVIPSMKQGDSYRGVFSLARGMYANSVRNIPPASKYPDGNMPTHTLSLTITWQETNESGSSPAPLQRVIPEIKILALDNPPASSSSSASSESSSSSGPIVTPIG